MTDMAENTVLQNGGGPATADTTQAPDAAAESITRESGFSETKAFSERLKSKTAELTGRLADYEKREADTAAKLREAGLPEKPDEAAEALVRDGKGLYLGRDAARDLGLLGEADARRAIEDGSAEGLAKKLEEKPVALRTQRDRAAYLALKRHLDAAAQRGELEKLGIDWDKLNESGEYAAFCGYLNPALAETQKYALYRRYAAPDAVRQIMPPSALAAAAPMGAADYFTPEQVDSMNREEVSKNLGKIVASMTKWGRKTR